MQDRELGDTLSERSYSYEELTELSWKAALSARLVCCRRTSLLQEEGGM